MHHDPQNNCADSNPLITHHRPRVWITHMQPIIIKQKRWPAWLCLLLTTPLFVIGFPCVLAIPGWVVDRFFDLNNPNNHAVTVPLALIAMSVSIWWTYLPVRAVYMALRWKDAIYDGGYCLNCNYNLTGNITGRCPECGELVGVSNSAKT